LFLVAILCLAMFSMPILGADEGCSAKGREQTGPPVIWVQRTAEDFNGTPGNASKFVDVLVDANGIHLINDTHWINQTNWTGGRNDTEQDTDNKVFYNSSGVRWSCPGNLSLLYKPTWTAKSPLIQERGAIKSAWDPEHNQVIVFGGFIVKSATRILFNNTEYYNPFTDNWTKGSSTPPGRQGPCLAWDSQRDRMYMFGGYDGSQGRFNDTWILEPGNGTGGSWTQLSGCAKPMENGVGVYDPNLDLFVCYGRSSMEVSIYSPGNDSWSEGNNAYRQRNYVAGTWWSERELFMITNGGIMTGTKPETGFYAPGNDSWIDGPDYPPSREHATLVWDDVHDVAILYGGQNDTNVVLNEAWFYDPGMNNWTNLENEGGPTIKDHAAVWDPINSQMLIIGGINASGSYQKSVNAMTMRYPSSSWLESSAFDTGGISRILGLYWKVVDAPAGVGDRPVKLQLASGATSSPSGYIGPDGTNATWYTSAGPVNSGVYNQDRYLRYCITLSTNDTDLTPVVGNVSIEYSSYRAQGSFQSSVFDTGLESPQGIEVNWSAVSPDNTSVNISIRSSDNSLMLFPSDWTPVTNGQNLTGIPLKRYVQYRIELKSPSRAMTPCLSRISITFNGVPSLSDPGHYPDVGNPLTEFTFHVKYADPDGRHPSSAILVLDNETTVLTPTTNGSSAPGLWYERSTALESGNHSYYFVFSDGFCQTRLPDSGAFDGPFVDAIPSLSNGTVTPAEGNTTGKYLYSVRYSDPEGRKPLSAFVMIDSDTNLTLEAQDAGNPGDSVYERRADLGAGNHSFFFKFGDGINEVRLPESGAFNGPKVHQYLEPLKVVSVSPANGSQNVSVNTSVVVDFNNPLDVLSVSSSSFSLLDSRGNSIIGNMTFKHPPCNATLKPAASLGYNETYSVRLSTGIKDVNGTTLGNGFTWSFSTEREIMVPPPPPPVEPPVEPPPVTPPPVQPVKENRPPVVLSRVNASVIEGEELTLDLGAMDPDGDMLYYEVISGPGAAQVSTTGRLTWKTAKGDRGTAVIVVEVSDTKNVSQAAITVTVVRPAGGGGTGNGTSLGDMFLPAAILATAAVAAALFSAALLMRRRRKGPPVPQSGHPEEPHPPVDPSS